MTFLLGPLVNILPNSPKQIELHGDCFPIADVMEDIANRHMTVVTLFAGPEADKYVYITEGNTGSVYLLSGSEGLGCKVVYGPLAPT
ncbi:MAG: hypothetical protein JO339_29920 [Alphaproteobacteria bacterium]|nr:hypothetical protein [Alphaproteobacteria bacterium]